MSVKNADGSTTVVIFYREGNSNRPGERTSDCGTEPFWAGFIGRIAEECPPIEDPDLTQEEQLYQMVESVGDATDFTAVDLDGTGPGDTPKCPDDLGDVVLLYSPIRTILAK